MTLTLVLLCALPAQAHDFWIEPANFRPEVGNQVPLRILVGEHFKGEPLIYLPELFERYIYVGAGGEKPVPGLPGDDPAGRVPVATPGPVVVGYRSVPSEVSFKTLTEFESYLVNEGMERIKVLREELGKRDQDIREIYSRSAKSLLYSGPARSGKADRKLGFRMELIAEDNPYKLKPGDTLPIQLIYEKRPLEGALVVAFTKDLPMEKLKVRTDKSGRAALKLPRAGTWLITSVHMVPAPAKSGADWESVWASLTFALAN